MMSNRGYPVLADLDPAARRALRRLGSAELAHGRTPEAIESLRMATTVDPADREAWRLLAEAHERAGEPGRAEAIRAFLRSWVES